MRLWKKKKMYNIASAIDDVHVEQTMQINPEYFETPTRLSGKEEAR